MILPKSIFSLVDHCGIYITNTSIRLIELTHQKSVKLQGEVKVNGSIFNGDEIDQSLLTDTLTTLINQTGSSAKYAVISLPEKIAFSREHIFPNLTLPEIQEAMDWQISSIFPFSPDEIYYDWKLIEKTKDQIKTVAVAVNRKIIDGLTQALTSLHIRPISFVPAATVLSHAFPATNPEDHIILDIDALGTSTTLVQHQVATLTTTTLFGNNTNSEDLLDNMLAPIATIISRTYGELKPQNLKIYLTGEKASDKLLNIISQKSGITTQLLPVINVAPPYHVAYLAALTAIEPPASASSINLLPHNLQADYQLEVESLQARQAMILGMIPAVFSLIMSVALTIVSIGQLKLVQQTAVKPAASAPSSNINIPSLLQKAQKITRIQPSNQIPDQIVQSLLTVQDESIKINQINIDMLKQTLELSVEGSGRAAFMNFKSKLEATNLFNRVTVPLGALSVDTTTNTKITMQIKPPLR